MELKIFYMKKIIIIILVFICVNVVNAQKLKFNGEDYFIEGGLRYGRALYHPKGSMYLYDLYYPGLEIRFGKQSSGDNKWEQLLNFPAYGLGLRYTSYWDFMDTKEEWKARNKVLGQSIAGFGYFKGTIIRYKWFAWNYQLGIGAVYFTKIYNKNVVYKVKQWEDSKENREKYGIPLEPDYDNPEYDRSKHHIYLNDEGKWTIQSYDAERAHNCIISVYVTPYFNLQSGFDFRLTEQLDLSLQANFCHASNASMNMPNYGINELQGIVSLRYHFNPPKELHKIDTFPKHKALNSLYFTIDPGWLIARYDDNYYFKTGASIGYMRKILPVITVGAGFEAFYVRFIKHSKDYNAESWADAYQNVEAAKADGIDPKKPKKKIVMPKNIHNEALYVFSELNFSRIAIHVGFGAYVYRGPGQAANMDLAQNADGGGTLKKYPRIYEKVGLRVYCGKKENFFTGFSLRAHAPVADYFAFDFGYKFFNFHDKK